MRQLNFLLLLLLVTNLAHAKIYKWVDENGSIHFSDKPYASEAKEIQIKETGITLAKEDEPEQQKPAVKPMTRHDKTEKPAAKEEKEEKEKEITEADYKISSSVGKLGADIMSISGRISAGPICKDMTVTASAKNENGLSASITAQTSKTNSYGSTTFAGNAKVGGSAEDMGFWNVDSVTIRCND